MRIVSWNIENLSRWLDPGSGLELASQMRALGDPEVLCLQEVRIRPQDSAAIEATRRLLPGYEVAFALADDPRNVSYRGGRAHGVATFVRESVGRRGATGVPWDREGRVVVTALANPQIVLVNVYAVNGTPKSYLDPETGASKGDRHAHKRRFQDQLFELLANLAATSPVVCIGDWNVSRSALDVTPRLRTEEPHAQARAELNAHLARTGFVDVFRKLHPEARQYTWFGKTRHGKLDAARVDYGVVSPDLVENVVDATILDDAVLRPKSDHAPLRIELTWRAR